MDGECDQVTVREINHKLTSEILNMQRLLSQFQLEDLATRLQNLNTLELYNEMMKCVQQTLVRFMQDKCRGDVTQQILFKNSILDNSSCIPIPADGQGELIISSPDEEDVKYSQENLHDMDRCYDTKLQKNPKHIDYVELKNHCEQLEADFEKFHEAFKAAREETRAQAKIIEHLREEIVDRDARVEELEAKTIELNKICENLRETLRALKDKCEEQDSVLESMKGENAELLKTVQIYVHQAVQAQKTIDDLRSEQRMNQTILEDDIILKTILEHKLNELNTHSVELQDEILHKAEYIEQLEKKIKDLENKVESNETNSNQLMYSAQRKLSAHEKIQRELKQIIVKKNFLINMYKSEINNNNNGNAMYLNKLRKSENRINLMMKQIKDGNSKTEVKRNDNDTLSIDQTLEDEMFTEH
ncbi:hypothetical protein M8J77_026195 [Diaphorina citri]|nr:hypothetical protein M8J77_026195 [Diaphorina citri]